MTSKKAGINNFKYIKEVHLRSSTVFKTLLFLFIEIIVSKSKKVHIINTLLCNFDKNEQHIDSQLNSSIVVAGTECPSLWQWSKCNATPTVLLSVCCHMICVCASLRTIVALPEFLGLIVVGFMCNWVTEWVLFNLWLYLS